MSIRRVAFTLIELLVVVAIIALLISILLPSLTRARDQAKAVKCGANLQQMGIALCMYVDENRGFFPGEHSVYSSNPPISTWPARLRRLSGLQEKMFWCPSTDPKLHWKGPVYKYDTYAWTPTAQKMARGYGYQLGETPLQAERDLFCYGLNGWGANYEFQPAPCRDCPMGLGAHVDDPAWPWAWSPKLAHIKMPGDMIAVTDSTSGNAGLVPSDSRVGAWDEAIDPDPWGGAEWPDARHPGTRQSDKPPMLNAGVPLPSWKRGAEVLFVDGHVTYMSQFNLVDQHDYARRRWNITYTIP